MWYEPSTLRRLRIPADKLKLTGHYGHNAVLGTLLPALFFHFIVLTVAVVIAVQCETEDEAV